MCFLNILNVDFIVCKVIYGGVGIYLGEDDDEESGDCWWEE